MKFLTKLIGGNIAETAKEVADVIDKFIETPDEKAAFKTVMAKMAQEPGLAQVELNKVSAGHRSVLVAGARPFLLWVCGVGLAFSFIVNPVIQWITGTPGPELPTGIIMELVIAMLGLAGLRTAEKMVGVSK
jgi:hypothetical protein